MARIILIRHENDPLDDRITGFIRRHGLSFEVRRPFLGESLGPVDSSVAATVIYGGSFNVFEEDRYPFLREENAWIESCIAQEIPLLGICQGAQSIARVLGAYAGPPDEKRCEFGYYEITATEAGKAYFPDTLTVPESHYHEFHLPKGADLLARSASFERQAFKYGKNVFAFQFHPEVVPSGFQRFQKRNTGHYAMPGAQDLQTQNALMQRHDTALDDWFAGFMEEFFAEVLLQR
ncbi:MAG: glutamine amidotransferase [Verrucomicrobiota bacterium]